MQKIYIVIYNNSVYSFQLWSDCKSFISDKDNIKYKGFFIEDTEGIKNFIDGNIKKLITPNQPGVLYAYLSGVKNFDLDINSWGSVLVKDDDIESEEAGIEEDYFFKEYQLKGEIAAAVASILFAIENNENRIVLIYDFMGIEMWANGSWKPKKPEYQEYVKFINSVRGTIKIDFIEKDRITSTSPYIQRSKELAMTAIAKGMKK